MLAVRHNRLAFALLLAVASAFAQAQKDSPKFP